MTLLKDMLYRLAALFAPRNAASILTYHSISDAKHFGAVTPQNFAKQMQLLKDRKFNVVSLDELARMRTEGRIPPRTVALTFDDGYKDNYTVAFPLLKQYGFPATIFVITDAIEGNWTMRGESFRMLSEGEIRELSASGLVSLQPHTTGHPKLTKITYAEIVREIRASKERLEVLTRKQCVHFAYPFGKYNSEALSAVREAGIEHAYTTDEGLVRRGDNELELHRSGINRTVTPAQFIGTALWGRLSRKRVLHI